MRVIYRRDYDHFSLSEPHFPELDDIESDLVKHEQVWGQFDEFRSSMDQFTSEEWIVFRSKTYKFEEFLAQWGRLEGGGGGGGRGGGEGGGGGGECRAAAGKYSLGGRGW